MEKFFIDFLTAISPALQILIQTLAVALAAQASAWLLKKYQVQRLELSNEQRYLLDSVTRAAVKAAEQMYTDSAIKREYAFKTVSDALTQYGIKIDAAQIYNQIEAQVFTSFTNPPVGLSD